MGLTINMGNKNSPPEAALIKALLKNNDMLAYETVRDVMKAEFKLGFYDVEMFVKNTKYMATMPVTVSNILKGGASEAQRNLCRAKLMSMFNSAMSDAGIGVPEAKEGEFPHLKELSKLSQSTKIPGMPKIGEIEAAVEKSNKGKAGQTLSQVFAEMEKMQKATQPKKVGNQLPPADGTPVALKDAVAIGQPVRGSSSGSVYYTVAMSERVKLAVRIKNDTISVRAEGDFLSLDVAKFQAFGMSAGMGGKYYSMHVSCDGVPVPRVMGAILMGLGIDFDQQVTNFKQIKVSA